MKKTLLALFMLISFSITAQNPCQDGTIIIDGNAIDAVLLENTNNTGLKLPLWLDAGTTLASGSRVHFISVIEFNEVNNAGNISLVYNKVIKVSAQTETVPSGKVWKVEAIVKHANAFASGFTASSNSPVCQGGTLNLSATTVAGATYSWTGPNGFTSSTQNPVINNATLTAAGTYSMTATLNGCTSTASTTDVVVNSLPVSTFTNDPTLAIINYNTIFYPTLTGVNYAWTFDQGTPSSSTAENPAVQWSTGGNYDVTLTVTDNNGCTSTTQQVVTVSSCTPGQPSSDFTWSIASPLTNQTVSFTPTTTGATYDWSFTGGSITTSTDENPDVSWSNTGTYNVSLTVTSGGCSTNTTQSIVVRNPTNVTFNYTGNIQTFTVPQGINSIIVEAYGAQGGSNSNGTSIGGKGGYSIATIPVTSGETLNIYVGGQGTSVTSSPSGGYNGGGGLNASGYGGTGGGASDVRRGTSLNDRIIVAGGGGGHGWVNYALSGGGGGGLSGTDGETYSSYPNAAGKGGTQTAGGAKGTVSGGTQTDGTFGQGGMGYGDGAGGGGGGGGWYGGGGSVFFCGGGGSGYVNYPGNTNTNMQTGVKTGNGQVTITY
jgi:hypothetical protein